MFNSKLIGNIQNKSKSVDSYDDMCQASEGYARGTEYVEMKARTNRVINIWACQNCAKKLGDNQW